MAAASASIGSSAAPSPAQARMYWCGYLHTGKASFALSPDGRHAVIEVGSQHREHLEEMRTELSVSGELREMQPEHSDVRWKLIFSEDRDTRRVLEVALLPGPPENEDAKIVYEAVFGSR